MVSPMENRRDPHLREVDHMQDQVGCLSRTEGENIYVICDSEWPQTASHLRPQMSLQSIEMHFFNKIVCYLNAKVRRNNLYSKKNFLHSPLTSP